MTIHSTPPRQYQGFVTLQLTRERKGGREALRMAEGVKGGWGGFVAESVDLQEIHLNPNKHTMT